MTDTLNTIITISPIVIGFLYVIGYGVSMSYLTMRGVDEISLLNHKYLSVGTSFLLIYLAFFLLGSLSSLVMFIIGMGMQVNFIHNLLVAILAASTLIIVFRVTKYAKTFMVYDTKRTVYSQFILFVALSFLVCLYPGYQLVGFIVGRDPFAFQLEWVDPAILILTSISSMVAVLIYYAIFQYGRHNPITIIFGTAGTGISTRVRFTFDKESQYIISNSGIPVAKRGLTDDLELIETTNNDYIVSIIPDDDPKTTDYQIIKVSKSLVRSVIHIREASYKVLKV